MDRNSGRGEKRPREDNDSTPGRSDNAGGDRGRGVRAGRSRPRQTWEERRQERLAQLDLVISRSVDNGEQQKKKGTTGRAVNLVANYFVLEKGTDWAFFHYRVDFLPEENDTRIKKKLMRDHAATLGGYIFDGSSLYVSNRISPDPLLLNSTRESDQTIVQLSIRLVAQLAPTDIMYLQIYNILLRKCSELMGLQEMGRHFYDHLQAINIPAHRLQLWPGYKTSMRNHERDILFGVELTHKVIRNDNCLDIMMRLRGFHEDNRQRIKDELIGSIVMTHYNNKTYRVDDIEWDKTPESTFERAGRAVTFADYYLQKYTQRVTNMEQPLLVSRPRRRDYHRGNMGPSLLIPELCKMTGLTDEMRGNFQLMRSLADHLRVPPDSRVDAIRRFRTRLGQAPGVLDELNKWGLRLNPDLVDLPGRVLDRENIAFRNNQTETVSEQSDWNAAFRNKQMPSVIPLENWVIIVPAKDAQAMDGVVSSLQRVGRPLGFIIDGPREIIRLPDSRIPSYMTAIDQAMANHRGNLQMVFVVLPKQVVDIYSAVKKRCSIDYGIPSQCFVAKNANNPRGLMSIATKVAIQLNAKLGGVPWTLRIPLEKLMIVGFDVHHCGRRRGPSVGAIVATTNATHSKYYSTTSVHNSNEELSTNLCTDFTKCMFAYQQVNKDLPNRIIMYRDGVGEGQLGHVYETELNQIKQSMKQLYESAGKNQPKFLFIVVTKKINTRIFAQQGANGRVGNPDPGTIVDDVITFPERFDFCLVSQFSRQGTVSPTSYNVLHDTQGLNADLIQRMTYKLCHTYFNWSGTITVPAPCQYAHKLAYFTGVALQGDKTSESLSHHLHFL